MTDFIRDYWESQARKHGASHEASWGDSQAVALEIGTVAGHLSDGDTVLDVGCVNGYSAFEQLARHRLKSLVGVDYSAAMIDEARKAKAARRLDDRITFHEGDVRSLDFPDGGFDVVYTTRVLINLASWEDQKRGVIECLRVARRGSCASSSRTRRRIPDT